jgi:hypothetical protein
MENPQLELNATTEQWQAAKALAAKLLFENDKVKVSKILAAADLPTVLKVWAALHVGQAAGKLQSILAGSDGDL